MFESITKNLNEAFSAFRIGGKLTEKNIRDGLQQVRQALLEADVSYDVTKEFIDKVAEEAVGDKVLKSLDPTEQVVGIVYQELVNLMGPVDHSLAIKRNDVSVIMMVGLQGSGKTTTCGKLARLLKEQGHRPLLVAADLQRPAAIEQLRVIGEQIGVPVYSEDPKTSSPLKVCQNGVKQAKKTGDADIVILDTAGRLHVDDELMAELEAIDRKVRPDQALLVCDAMTGQDAVNSAKTFNEALEIDGVILSKMDGDTRGGAALSVKQVTGVPIKFIGVGEQLDRLEEFHPDRMASRIMGGGDLQTLMEKAQREFDADDMERQQQKMREGKFSLEDFRNQMRKVRSMGPMKEIMKMIPGMGGMLDAADNVDADKEMSRIEAIIGSMTMDERENPQKIDRNRRNRIAIGSGCDPTDVSQLLKQYDSIAGMMKGMAGGGMKDQWKAMRQMQEMGMSDPSGALPKEKNRSKRGGLVSKEEKRKQNKKQKQARKKNRRK
ncbi:Signal recognition particle protein [Polystyrenella longa]|uniref:Signal recognition particle protein n=1 Tax=Polystyrenella longa TaxID=2528007 RepID=A0A518CGM2_9PLAN|nr:signal recognition particle protein [Polystyrenella longa]QDU78376.1 Signal recognition particle protein [Polystyrenella longa]